MLFFNNFKNKLGLVSILFCGAIVSASCGSSDPNLSGKYQAEEDKLGIEFLSKNNAVISGYGIEGTESLTYEILKGEDGLSIKFSGWPLESKVFDLEKDENTLYLSEAGSS